MTDYEKVYDYLKNAGLFFVTTVDGDKPKCRPFSLMIMHDGRIYFGAGTFKAVYRQLQANPHIEICASDGVGFLRYYGKAAFAPDPSLEQAALDSMPELRGIYNAETGKRLGMFYLTDAVAEFCGVAGVNETIKF